MIRPDGEQAGIMERDEALEYARDQGLDLVEVSPHVDPPVCRVMDYGKFQFERSKVQQGGKKKTRQMQIKEVKFRPNTDTGDYQVKLRNLIRFLNDGDKAKVTLRFRGREMQHQDLGLDLLNRVRVDLEEYGVVEQEPKLEGRQMVMMLSARKKKG